MAAIIFADLALSEGHPDEICAATLVIRAMLLGGATSPVRPLSGVPNFKSELVANLGSERVADLEIGAGGRVQIETGGGPPSESASRDDARGDL